MECNKDEATRAKDIAIRKFTEKDFAGAKKFALKAQTLYSRLEGITQMIATLEVFLSAETKMNGEMDMYGVLGVSPLADDDTIRKHYRKLALQLHPDKNKFIGADGAFQIVTQAFNFLSDKSKRAAYNSRRNVKTYVQKSPCQTSVSKGSAGSGHQPKFATHAGFSVPSSGTSRSDQKVPTQRGVSGSSNSAPKVPNQSGKSAVPPGVNGYHKYTGSTSSNVKAPKSNSRKSSPSVQSYFKKTDTFWTICTRCKMQYEYMRVYLNQILKCPHCQVGFKAVEVHAPSNIGPIQPDERKSSSTSAHQMPGFNNSFGAASNHWSSHSGTAHNGTLHNNYSFAEKGKSEYEAAGKRKGDYSGFVSTGEGPKKMREIDDLMKNGTRSFPSQSGIKNWETGTGFSSGQSFGNSQAGKPNYFPEFIPKVNNVNRELSAMELRRMLIEKARLEIRKKLNEWESAKAVRISAKEKEKSKQKKSKLVNHAARQDSESEESPDAGVAEQEAIEMVTMTVPDPDFHIFDSDRSESCFGANQVWAAYDNDDGMPRFYAIIHEVLSTDPFMVRLSWLNSKTSSEFGPIDWVGNGFNKTCGDFRVEKRELFDSLNSFSHKIKGVNESGEVIQIYPRKGEIWALYKNWSPNWNKDTVPEDIVHAYEMVEVQNDYNEKQGVDVSPIVKATGFRTVFYKQPDPNQVKHIPKSEMFRFSHQVPSHVLTGEEGPNALKGYVELDPAATPSELLQVTPSGT
ncbi:uncharacterized protein LOC130825528 [Amaranthus tricolor]|uniref:uncharacterized protein LOC130825528 n=1 Tax=Amaranthus tricolor TaxID=29722 RepID=UPI002582EC2A|nr:uncharacterized protein LOC130825528 [Amaranthus tricolor]XP_057546783.1 uncharacterized protein LOC130825528 [Amaranthus tricolor]XP_057546784.1 uncharacterized protein LOC130825528 [Amaranthus tricolor]